MSYFFKSIFYSKEKPGVKLIVFDFDGTLADTKELLIKIVERHIAKFNISLTANLLKVFGNAPLRDYISISGIRKDLVNSVTQSIEEDFLEEYKNIKLAKNIYSIAEIDVKKVIVSNNITEFIKKTLSLWKIDFFEKVYGADRFMDKVHAIKNLCKRYRISPEEVLYVGDKDKDVLVARESGCYSVIVSSSIAWSSRKDIELMKPDFIISDLSTLPEILKLINSVQIPSI